MNFPNLKNHIHQLIKVNENLAYFQGIAC